MLESEGDIKLSEAIKNKDWKNVLLEKLASLYSMKTWKLIDLPQGAKPSSNCWVLRQKENGRLKARLVQRGFEQKEEVDYFENFSLVVIMI